jgi:hypothetical protein
LEFSVSVGFIHKEFLCVVLIMYVFLGRMTES